MNSPPSTLGQYQIIREIARSNDIVYEAYDPLMNRRVAIKELAMPQGATSQQQEERINRFKREAQAAGTLNHPNIMTVFSFAEDNGRTFMAMEYLDGCTLRNELDTKGSLPIDRAVEIIGQVLEGLAHAHSKGVIHRDIKPDNIQILSNGTIKITDFGIARLTFQPNLTMDGQVFGTPSYMSPEQVVGREIDARSDLFSVGVVLYEMLAGQKPFAGDSVVSITYAIMNAEPPHPPQANFAIWQVLTRALDKSPQMRYANADDMSKAIKDAIKATQSGAMAAVPPPATGTYAVGPYMTPPPAPTGPPPPIYAYNPYQPHSYTQPSQAYQTSPYQTSPYQAGPSMMPPGNIPIYYPPPPRQPLIKPETASFMKRVALTFLIVGTLFLLLLEGINALVSGLSNASQEQHDVKISNELSNLPANMPVEEKIDRYKSELGKHLAVGVQAELRHRLAALYEVEGNQALAHADTRTAEVCFAQGAEVDPSNAALWSDHAKVLSSLIGPGSDPELMMDAGNSWLQAATLEHDTSKSVVYGKGAAQAFLAYAQSILATQDRDKFRKAREALYNARTVTDQNDEIQAKITDMLAQLS
ncbi:MAG: serine/threonine-protein kinase [Fimbriimonas sp.]|nr:serine/threonine-protein kinase [Fimbriimonas sp.]